MKVSDVMSKEVDFVRSYDTVDKVAMLIFGRNINGVPVCEGKKVIGFVTEKDILDRFFPSTQEFVEDTVHESNFQEMEEKASTILSLPVSQIMSKNPTTIHPNMPLLKAQALMTVKEIGRLPVVDENHKLIGILSKGDVFRSLIGEQINQLENVEYNDFLTKTYYSTVDWEDRLTKEIPDLIKLFEEHNVKTVLDVGCGTGDYAIELAKRGYNIIGVDRSRNMINEAKRRKVGLTSEQYGKVNFLRKDAEDFLYEMDIKFDAILVMGNALSHNPENYRRLLKGLANNLSENGIMVLQTTNFERVLKTKKRIWKVNFVPTVDNVKEYCFIDFYDKPDRSKTILKTIAILASDGKRWRLLGIRNSLMAYTDEAKIKSILENEGFKKIETFGGSYDGRHWDYLFRKPFKPLESDWLNIIASGKKA